MKQSKITFTNNNSILIDENTELIIIKYTKDNIYNMSSVNEFNENITGRVRTTQPLTIKAASSSNESLSLKIIEILHNTDFFYVYNKPNKIFSTSAIFAIEDIVKGGSR
ncbi:hypothetical protein [Leuconostoc sp. MTCC 10508]|uniref:hypothetical protein n=1 Tax=Leuconostoc sp. MTCC 10508 TaxID=2698683 RepID=UPI0020C04F98|nr:hypothetical protein [Leuconostoc sp. MTCC 10508]